MGVYCECVGVCIVSSLFLQMIMMMNDDVLYYYTYNQQQ